MLRPIALTIPVVVENSWPKGLPIVMASWPTRTLLLSPKVTGVSSSESLSIFKTARSESSSRPTISASTSVPSEKTTVIRLSVNHNVSIGYYMALIIPDET